MLASLSRPRDSVSWSRYALLRVFFFGLLAYDLVSVTFKHAARYGVDGFNVPQFTWMTALTPVPNAEVVGGLWLACALFALFSAAGVLTTFSIRMTCVLYSGIYFSSQIDSYQHHYLLCLLLFLFALPNQQFWSLKTSNDDRRSWMPTLLYLQIALVYFWTGIAKADSTWLTGVTLESMSNSEIVLSHIGSLAASLYGVDTDPSLALDAMYRSLSVTVMTGELLIPLCFLFKRLRILGLVLTPFFHIGVEMLGLDIELFSFYMISLNTLLLSPAGPWLRIDNYCREKALTEGSTNLRSRLIIIVGMVLTLGLLSQLEFPTGKLYCILAAAVVGLQLVLHHAGVRHASLIAVSMCALSASLVWMVKDSESLYDYYRLKGGDLARRLPTPQSPAYPSAIKEVIDTYQLANAQRPEKPARRAKVSRYLRYDNQQASATATLVDGHRVHENAIATLGHELTATPSREGYEALVKTQIGQAKICKALKRAIPAPAQLTSTELDQCITAMKLETIETLKALRNHNRTVVLERFEDRLNGWRDDNRYDPNSGLVNFTVSAPGSTVSCDEDIQTAAQKRYQFMALTFGVPLSRKMVPTTIKRIAGTPCSATVHASLNPLLSYLSVRGGYARVSRARNRTFKGAR